jgi:hypothetical protein
MNTDRLDALEWAIVDEMPSRAQIAKRLLDAVDPAAACAVFGRLVETTPGGSQERAIRGMTSDVALIAAQREARVGRRPGK